MAGLKVIWKAYDPTYEVTAAADLGTGINEYFSSVRGDVLVSSNSFLSIDMFGEAGDKFYFVDPSVNVGSISAFNGLAPAMRSSYFVCAIPAPGVGLRSQKLSIPLTSSLRTSGELKFQLSPLESANTPEGIKTGCCITPLTLETQQVINLGIYSQVGNPIDQQQLVNLNAAINYMISESEGSWALFVSTSNNPVQFRGDVASTFPQLTVYASSGLPTYLNSENNDPEIISCNYYVVTNGLVVDMNVLPIAPRTSVPSGNFLPVEVKIMGFAREATYSSSNVMANLDNIHLGVDTTGLN